MLKRVVVLSFLLFASLHAHDGLVVDHAKDQALLSSSLEQLDEQTLMQLKQFIHECHSDKSINEFLSSKGLRIAFLSSVCTLACLAMWWLAHGDVVAECCVKQAIASSTGSCWDSEVDYNTCPGEGKL